jgi:hypothetical protein
MKKPNNHIYLLLVAWLLLINLTTNSQYIYKTYPWLNTYYGEIKESNSKLKDSIPFSYISIIDGRLDTISIGFRKCNLLCYTNANGKHLSLQYFINSFYNSKCKAGATDTLILYIEKFSIREDVHYTDGAPDCWQMHSKFYTGSNQSYRYLGSFVLEEYGHSKWKKHLFHIFDDVIKEAINSYKSNLVNSEALYSPDSLYNQVISMRSLPILTQPLKPGFYYGFKEFINNEPGFTYTNDSSLNKLLELMHYKYFYENIHKKKSKVIPDTTYWGFSDGRNIFIRNGKCFYQIGRCDAAFYFLATFFGIDWVKGERIGNGFAAAIVIGISAAANSSYAPYYPGPNTPIPYIEVPFAGEKTAGYTLDFTTGRIVF